MEHFPRTSGRRRQLTQKRGWHLRSQFLCFDNSGFSNKKSALVLEPKSYSARLETR
jgi:hypothetical protein